jgi:hypothetical protein
MEFSEGASHSGTDKDTLYIFGGAALILFGTGVVLANPLVRRYLGQFDVGNLLQHALADIDRYFKLRAM